MKQILFNKNALSPVVAAIILIAVTVTVSIAVAAWMGSLTTSSMKVSELTITHIDFAIGDASNGRLIAYVTNSGTSDVTIHRIRVNGENEATWSSGSSDTIEPGESEVFTVTRSIATGSKYTITLYTVDGVMVGSYSATA
jgi:flagellin-like protein